MEPTPDAGSADRRGVYHTDLYGAGARIEKTVHTRMRDTQLLTFTRVTHAGRVLATGVTSSPLAASQSGGENDRWKKNTRPGAAAAACRSSSMVPNFFTSVLGDR